MNTIDEEKWKDGYKIVGYGYESGSFISLVPFEEKRIVEYKIGSITKANLGCGPLSLFSNLDDEYLKGYIRRYSRYFPIKIFKCRYVKSIFDCIWDTSGYPAIGLDHLHDYISDACVLADQVELVSEIDLKDIIDD